MRNITNDAKNAFNANINFSNGNTIVKNTENHTRLLLHGNRIAGKDAKGFYVDACGWLTNTTKERLNALTGVSIHQKKWCMVSK